MGRNQNTFAKRQREVEKKRKGVEKFQKRMQKKADAKASNAAAADVDGVLVTESTEEPVSVGEPEH